MKKLLLALLLITLTFAGYPGQLILVHTDSFAGTKRLFKADGFTVNYYHDKLVIGTLEGTLGLDYHLLDRNAWAAPGVQYYILRYPDVNKPAYKRAVQAVAGILYEDRSILVVSADRNQAALLYPACHGGMVRISPRPARLPGRSFSYSPAGQGRSQVIAEMIGQVSADSLEAKVQHLQDYGTRNAYTPQSVQAQNWIYDKFASYGLDVELHDFYMPGGNASDNVIATLSGSKYPDEYVVLGAHYDSYAWGGNGEPGADDNATGTAGILEAARIMSQYQFDRSIIFATWSGEEYGLYGSDAWATEAAENGMNILGYFNMDMAGYLYDGYEIHTDMIAPSSAQELVEFYIDVCAQYLPDFAVNSGGSIGGDSDHTSFNENGYMGIFPFEDSDHYSPYIHSDEDTIGPSVNSFEMNATFTMAIIANVAEMASMLQAPSNLIGFAGDGVVDLVWDPVDSVDYYNIYRNGGLTPYATSPDASYTDLDVENATPYTYYVTAVYPNTGDESRASNQVTVVPMPPISLPFFDDFETGGYYWTFDDEWGLNESIYHSPTHSMNESPEGYYLPGLNSSATLRAVNLSGAFDAVLSFWTMYQIEEDWDFMYLEVSADGNNWDQLDVFTGNLNSWTYFSYSLDNYLDAENLLIRFRFTSDNNTQYVGMFIDDFEVMVGYEGTDEKENTLLTGLQCIPNPAAGQTRLNFTLLENADVLIRVFDMNGKLMKEKGDANLVTGSQSVLIDISALPEGTYQCVVTASNSSLTTKLVIIR